MHEPSQRLVADVRGYAEQTQHGFEHVWRWVRVLESFGALEGMTVAEAEDNADRFMASRWDPVADELRRLQLASGDAEADQQLIARIRGYARQTQHGFEHVWRWIRALKSLGAVEAMTAAEARDNAGRFMASRWDPVADELAELEGSTAADLPNRAPQVDTAAANYAWFTAGNNAPRGVIVFKLFRGVFSDPDGDELTYSIGVAGEMRLIDVLLVRESDQRLFFRADADDDWDAMVPAVPDDPVVTVTVTATDPDGLSASVQGDFLIRWEPQPAETDCELTAPSSVSGLGVPLAAVISWSLPEDNADTCEVAGFVVGATGEGGSRLETRIDDPEAREHVLRGLDPGDYLFHVRVEYAEGSSDDLVTMRQNNVPATCEITLTVQPYSEHMVSGRWVNATGTPSGCVHGPEVEFHFKRTQDDYYMEYGRFPNRPQPDPDLPAFIIGGLKPHVSYDFKVVAVDAAGAKHDSNTASATITSDHSVTADENSPRNVRVHTGNNSQIFVRGRRRSRSGRAGRSAPGSSSGRPRTEPSGTRRWSPARPRPPTASTT